MQVAEKHGSLKVVVYEGLKWHHRQAQEDSKLNNKKRPPNRNKAAVSCPFLLASCRSSVAALSVSSSHSCSAPHYFGEQHLEHVNPCKPLADAGHIYEMLQEPHAVLCSGPAVFHACQWQ